MLRFAATVLVAGAIATPALAASANFVDGKGAQVGTAQLTELPQGVLIRIEAQGIPEGWHGLHIHAVGKCEGPGFQSAAGHFNPAGHKHGFQEQGGAHAGDLPNIYADAQGRVRVELFSQTVALTRPQGNIFDADGAALVIHAKADDYKTDPAGDSGDRIACAVIQK